MSIFSEEINKKFKDIKYIKINEENDFLKLKFLDIVSLTDLLEDIKYIYELENKYDDKYCLLDLKEISLDKLKDVFKFSLEYEDLKDPNMIINIINLIKTYNTLDDTFFENKNIYINSLIDYLDIKLELKEYLQNFNKKLSIRFYSLLKSNNKINMDDNSNCKDLENIYNIIFQSIDFSTMCGILSITPNFSTEETYFIKNSKEIIDKMLINSYVSNELLQSFLGYFNNDNTKE